MTREMIPEDRSQVLKLIREFSDDKLNLFGMDFDEKSAGVFFDVLIVNEMLVAVVSEKDGVIVGMIAGLIGAKMFTASRTLHEIGWFVNKDNRGCGIRLLKEFERIGKDRGCSDILLGGFISSETDELYGKLGYDPFQKTFLKRI